MISAHQNHEKKILKYINVIIFKDKYIFKTYSSTN